MGIENPLREIAIRPAEEPAYTSEPERVPSELA
jgi:hypothetical protein